MCLSAVVMGDATHVRLSGDSLSAYVCSGQCWLVLSRQPYTPPVFPSEAP